MNLSFLFPFIMVAFIALAAFLIYRSPLDMQVVLKRTGTSTVLTLSASWSALTLESAIAGGEGSFSLFFLQKKIIRREVSQKSEVRKRSRTVPELFMGYDLLQTIAPGWDMIRFLKAVFRHMTLRKIEGTFTVGLQNPADTGVLFGCFSAIRPFLLPCNRITLSIKPVFDREILEGHVMADFRISQPLFIPVLLLRMAMKPGAGHLIRKVSSHTAGIP
jgi:hypothetical protein